MVGNKNGGTLSGRSNICSKTYPAANTGKILCVYMAATNLKSFQSFSFVRDIAIFYDIDLSSLLYSTEQWCLNTNELRLLRNSDEERLTDKIDLCDHMCVAV